MTLTELYEHLKSHPEKIRGYMKAYEDNRIKELNKIASMHYEDLGIQLSLDIPTRTKCVVMGLIRGALNDSINKKYDEIINELKLIQKEYK